MVWLPQEVSSQYSRLRPNSSRLRQVSVLVPKPPCWRSALVGSPPKKATSLRVSGFAALVERSASWRSEEHTSELQSLMRISYAVFCLRKKRRDHDTNSSQ